MNGSENKGEHESLHLEWEALSSLSARPNLQSVNRQLILPSCRSWASCPLKMLQWMQRKTLHQVAYVQCCCRWNSQVNKRSPCFINTDKPTSRRITAPELPVNLDYDLTIKDSTLEGKVSRMSRKRKKGRQRGRKKERKKGC